MLMDRMLKRAVRAQETHHAVDDLHVGKQICVAEERRLQNVVRKKHLPILHREHPAVVLHWIPNETFRHRRQCGT